MTTAAAPTRFAALRDRHSRPYLFAAGLAMMGDNIEHVITYWVLWQKFHSTALTGFEIISHWLPFLLLSVTFGGLAQRYDCRRLIQIAQVLFMCVSVVWGILFATDTLQVWMACVLLVLHGCAGSLWAPAEQLLLHDFAEPADLPGAIRLNATFRSLGILFGPAVGSVLLLGLGPHFGIWANVVFYLPMTILLFRTPFTGHTRDGVAMGAGAKPVGGPGAAIFGSVRTIREVRLAPAVVSMLVLSGLMALFVGGAIQVSMPEFAVALGAGSAGLAYGVLLFANGIGAVLGGFLLEAIGVLKPNVLTAVLGTIFFGGFILLFATTGSYWLAVVALVVAGVANMASMSFSQSIVQLMAPPGERGRIVGLFSTVSSGFRTGSGIILAVLGAIAGLRGALAWSALILFVGAIVIGLWTWWDVRRDRRAPALP
ncbi:MFS transporter [Frondihabitans australicus]|uniref:MFS-type transporter involved in bile tolerance (Atg22 family) n=1 Tax=Frondihabitans australicus TaxID=386892 RepID=A0A495IL73_9MICO|nr:MFS transporter [Frondihabitans australicus]RKR76519.1 MFS-type transporter involved in bile tolerance (Atg22 family) [Frondihabitans australicus]